MKSWTFRSRINGHLGECALSAGSFVSRSSALIGPSLDKLYAFQFPYNLLGPFLSSATSVQAEAEEMKKLFETNVSDPY